MVRLEEIAVNPDIFLLIVADLVAAVILTFGLYWRRHYRRDLVVAFMGINVGVLSVSAVLADSDVGAGVGLGLFGVLSIIRLRSDELAQHEIAYYFAMLALGLLGGLDAAPLPLSLLFMVLVVLTMAVIDHPSLLGGHHRQEIVVDRAIADPAELRAHLAELLDAQIHAVTVSRLDLVNDTTTVDVRFRRPRKDMARVVDGAGR
ncbi:MULTISPECIES: DUF4956 domain-containing protein [unclassified Brachybacterium]|uniref:DUF4956 domain-containing protein n=1 Tax=unclassified Brachybacterium TaxID=2623841 RepID=UPI00403320A4